MAELEKVTVPDIGDFDEVEVVDVLVSEGDEVAAEDSLITLESDKASMDVPSPGPGTVRKVHLSVGDEVATGDLILEMEPAGEAGAAPEEAEPEEAEPEEEPEKEPEAGTAPEEAEADEAEEETTGEAEAGEEEPADTAAPPSPEAEPVRTTEARAPSAAELPYASPAVRKLAREMGVDLSRIQGSGRKGRILPGDVESPAGGAPTAPGTALPPMPEIDFTEFGEVEEQKLTRINRLTGESVHRSWLHVPHVTHFDEADITRLEEFRDSHKEEARDRGFKLTFLSFLLVATAAALREFPRFNSSLSRDGESILVKQYVNIGIAVDTPKGLVVPVIRDVDDKRVYELAEELADVSERARDGKLTPSDFEGGTFTISSLGGIGGTGFTPIVKAPEVAILGVSRASMQPVWDDAAGEFLPRLILPFALSYDHRVIDGAAAARFTRHLGHLLSDVRRLLL